MSDDAPEPRTPQAAEAWLRRWIPDSHQEDADAALADLRAGDTTPDDARVLRESAVESARRREELSDENDRLHVELDRYRADVADTPSTALADADRICRLTAELSASRAREQRLTEAGNGLAEALTQYVRIEPSPWAREKLDEWADAWREAVRGDAPTDGPRCRYCGADCSTGRSHDGGDLYACPSCADARAARNAAPAAAPTDGQAPQMVAVFEELHHRGETVGDALAAVVRVWSAASADDDTTEETDQ